MQKKQKFLSSNSKAYILDEEKRIVRIKASNADYDSDNDRIFVEGWTLRKGASFIDAHKSGGSIDLKYGEILKAYTMDGYWMNDVQLKNPNVDSKGESRDPATWTEGEKVANSLWEGIMKGEDVRVSVGFMYDPDKITNNEKGGYDFRGQEQYELSAVIVPANANAGIKSAKDNQEKAIDYDSIPKSEIDLRTQIYKAIKEKYTNMNCYVVSVRTDTFIVNIWGENGNDNWVDNWYEIGYTVNELTGVTLAEEKTEVTDVQVWVRKELEKSGINKAVETLTNELNTVKEITQELNVKSVKKTLTPRLKKSLEIKSKKSLNKIEGKKTIKKLNGDKKED